MKVWAAGGQNYFVGAVAAGVAGQSDVDKVLLVAQMPETVEYARMKVVPFEQVLLLAARRRRRGSHGARPPGTHGRGHQRCYRDHCSVNAHRDTLECSANLAEVGGVSDNAASSCGSDLCWCLFFARFTIPTFGYFRVASSLGQQVCSSHVLVFLGFCEYKYNYVLDSIIYATDICKIQ